MAKRNTATVDEAVKTKLSKDHLKKLGGYMKKHTKAILFTIGLMLVSAFLGLLPPYFISKVVDVILPAKDMKGLITVVVILVLVQFLVWHNQVLRGKTIHKVGEEIIHDMRLDLFKHLQELQFSYFDSVPHGKIIVRVVNYINSISSTLSNGIVDIITNVFMVVVIVGFMLSMDVMLTLICVVGVPIFIVFLTILRKIHRTAWEKYSAKQSNLNAYIHENIEGMKVTQSFAREEKNKSIFAKICGENRFYWMKAKKIELFIPVGVNFLSVIVTILIYVYGAQRVMAGTLGMGELLAFAAYNSRFWTPIGAIAGFYNQIVTCSVYIERIFDLMEEPVTVKNLPGAVDLPPIEGHVEFKNVSFKYEPDEPYVLKDISFEVKPGESIAIVGPTGAGKSTIINLLSRFYNIDEGKVLIDGHDVMNVTLESLRSRMGIMLQDSFLFTGTIMENIRYSKLDATDEEVIAAAKTVCAHDFISELPDGYNTMVEERGATLSQGQRQLIAFARAILADPDILILDEATSSIDTETEIALQNGLEKLLKGRTSFIVAHRLSTIKNSSQIMYISDHKILERGTHDELLKLGGKYADLYNAQFKFINV